MSNNRPRAVDPKRKSDEALNVADFKIDDILNVPGNQLLAEVAKDFGDPAFLAAQFDSTALPAVSGHDRGGVNRDAAVTTFSVWPAALGAASVRAFSRPPPAARWSFFRAALAILAEWLVVPLRRRIFLGMFATLLLVVALTPGIYPLLVNRSDDRMTTLSQDDPLTQLPAPTLSRPLPTENPAPVGLPISHQWRRRGHKHCSNRHRPSGSSFARSPMEATKSPAWPQIARYHRCQARRSHRARGRRRLWRSFLRLRQLRSRASPKEAGSSLSSQR
jgi:hypothetical protein